MRWMLNLRRLLIHGHGRGGGRRRRLRGCDTYGVSVPRDDVLFLDAYLDRATHVQGRSGRR